MLKTADQKELNNTCRRHPAVDISNNSCDKCEKNKEKRRIDTQKRIQDGFCRNHKNERILEGLTCCQVCVDQELERRNERKTSQKCIHHPGKDVREGLTVCDECADYDVARGKIWRDSLKERGICARHFPEKTKPGMTICQICEEEFTERYATKKAAGLCPNHFIVAVTASPGKVFCYDCQERANNHTQERRNFALDEGLCRLHLKRTAELGLLCGECWFSDKAQDHLDDYSRGKELRQLLELQNYICTYTGVVMIPGVNASVDHKISKSRGGRDVIENIHWVDLDINMMKRNFLHEEFVDTCKWITEYAMTGKCDNLTELPLRPSHHISVLDFCKNHKNKPADIGRWCLDCWFLTKAQEILKRHEGAGSTSVSYKLGAELKELLFHQKNRCIYTGTLLVPGINASPDHIIPVSRSGGSDISNIQWTDIVINLMKRNKTHEEFLAIAECVAKRSFTC